MTLYLKKQAGETAVVERNEGMNIEMRHKPFHINVPRYFHAFRNSLVLIQQVFCASIQ